MTTQDHLNLQQRRERVLQRLDEAHKVLQESLEGIDPSEFHCEVLHAAERHCGKVVMLQAGQ